MNKSKRNLKRTIGKREIIEENQWNIEKKVIKRRLMERKLGKNTSNEKHKIEKIWRL